MGDLDGDRGTAPERPVGAIRFLRLRAEHVIQRRQRLVELLRGFLQEDPVGPIGHFAKHLCEGGGSARLVDNQVA